MSAFTTQELAEHAGLNSDGMAGFEAQVAFRTAKREVVWPEHLRDKRVDDYRRGSAIARAWMAMRRGVGTHRKSYRREELNNFGIMTVLSPCNAADRKAEQIETLKQVAEFQKKVDDKIALDRLAE